MRMIKHLSAYIGSPFWGMEYSRKKGAEFYHHRIA
jgi:hypothetical protein